MLNAQNSGAQRVRVQMTLKLSNISIFLRSSSQYLFIVRIYLPRFSCFVWQLLNKCLFGISFLFFIQLTLES